MFRLKTDQDSTELKTSQLFLYFCELN